MSLQERTSWLENFNETFKGLKKFYNHIHYENRKFTVGDSPNGLEYSDRIFDTIARILEVKSPCCAVIPILTGVNGVGVNSIHKLHIGYNFTLDANETASFNSIAAAIVTNIVNTEGRAIDDRVYDLLGAIVLNGNTYYNFKNSANRFLRKEVCAFEKKRNEGREINLAEELRQVEADQIKKALESGANIDQIQVAYKRLIEYCKSGNFFSNIHHVSQKSDLFSICRIYIDCKKLLECLPQYYNCDDFSQANFFILHTNQRKSHTEVNLIDKIYSNDGLFPYLYDNTWHLGISKLSCQICYDFFEELGLRDKLLGCHGMTEIKSWGLPNILIPGEDDNDNLNWLLTTLLPQIIARLSDAKKRAEQRPHPLRQISDLSDDEDEVDYAEGELYGDVKQIVTNVGLDQITYDLLE